MEESVVFDVVAGCYEQVLLGYELRLNDEQQYQFKLRFTEHSHTGCIKCLAVSDTHLASGSSDETIQLYNLKLKTDIGSLMQHEGSVTSIGFYSNTHLLSGSEDGTLCIWKTGTWDCLKTLKGHKGGLISMSIHPSGKLAMSIGKDKSLRTWNLIIGRTAYITNIKKVGELILFSPSGNNYVVATDTKIDVYNLESASITHSFDVGFRIFAVTFLTEDIIAVAGDCEAIKLFSIEEERCLQQFTAHSKRVKSLKCVANPVQEKSYSKLLLSASSDGFIKLWSVDTKKMKHEPVLLTEVNTLARLTCLAVAARKPKKSADREKDKKPPKKADEEKNRKDEETRRERHSPEKKRSDGKEKKKGKKRRSEESTKWGERDELESEKKKKKHKDKQKEKKKQKTN
ncbi:p21-activated protein kinase-interacting protein 1-like [Ptychodera flava]|uniref:p21-activated protein kinase-interacting protein 1-like n=1 Tax=Ptychodera flava TaxID=63121 RepID=UPI00396A8AE2